MRFLLFLGLFAASSSLFADADEFVDWGAGLSLESGAPLRVHAVQLQLTWDEAFSRLVLKDFPGVLSRHLSPRDLNQLHVTYGLSEKNRQFVLNVWWNSQPLKAPLTLRSASSDGMRVTLTYEIPIDLSVEQPGKLRVELYDPTDQTDMGIRGKDGAYLYGSVRPDEKRVTFGFEQDTAHPYAGNVLPEEVVFALRP